MFTGIVEARGLVRSANGRLQVEAGPIAEDVAIGDSVAVNGVCLTVAERGEDGLIFDLAGETLDRTTLGGLSAGDPVNLERPVTLLTRLGGHLVQGHVDGVGTIEHVEEEQGGTTVRISIPESLRAYLVEKGSIAVDGVSLTVAGLEEASFTVALVPHTLAATTLGVIERGDLVNLEVDVLAKYVESLLERRP
jgi:riboflavin synthase